MPSVLKLIFMYNICKQANDLSVIKDALAFKVHIYKILTFRGPGAQNRDPKPKILQLI